MTSNNTRNLFSLRVYSFLQFGSLGFILPFINLFYSRNGITAEKIGVLITLGAIISIVISPMLGAIAAKSKNPISIIQISLLLSGLFQGFISQQTSMFAFAVLVILYSMALASVLPLSISMTQDILDKVNGKAGYGSIRLFGSLGWSLVTINAGQMVENYGIKSIFIGYIVLVILSAIVLNFINYRSEETVTKGKGNLSFIAGIKSILKDRALIGFGFTVLVLNLAMVGTRGFEPLFFDSLGAPESLIGIAVTISAMVEVPVMLWADKLLKLLNSTNIIRISIVLIILRTFVILISPTIPMLIVGRYIVGISYGFYAIANAQFIRERAQSGQNALLQAIYNITIPGIAAVLVTPFVGRIYDREGGVSLYRIGFIGSVIALSIFIATVKGKRSKRVLIED